MRFLNGNTNTKYYNTKHLKVLQHVLSVTVLVLLAIPNNLRANTYTLSNQQTYAKVTSIQLATKGKVKNNSKSDSKNKNNDKESNNAKNLDQYLEDQGYTEYKVGSTLKSTNQYNTPYKEVVKPNTRDIYSEAKLHYYRQLCQRIIKGENNFKPGDDYEPDTSSDSDSDTNQNQESQINEERTHYPVPENQRYKLPAGNLVDGTMADRFALLSYAKSKTNHVWHYSQSNRALDGYADCSAFVYKCYRDALGIEICGGHGNSNIPNVGTIKSTLVEITEDQLLPGDILAAGSGSNRHTGLYIDKEHAVHSSQEGTDVIISDLNPNGSTVNERFRGIFGSMPEIKFYRVLNTARA